MKDDETDPVEIRTGVVQTTATTLRYVWQGEVIAEEENLADLLIAAGNQMKSDILMKAVTKNFSLGARIENYRTEVIRLNDRITELEDSERRLKAAL